MAYRPAYRNRRIPVRSRQNLPIRRGRRPRWWLWLAAILAWGAFGYFLYWLTNDDSSARPQVAGPVPSLQIAKPEPAEPKSPAKPASKPVPAAAEPAPREPRFTFYTLLPEKEITIPEGEVRARKRAESLGQIKPNDYFIQVGSFYSAEEAGRIQAELSRLGIKSRLDKTEIGKVIWYRVRIGPFGSLREVESIRARLRKQGIDSVVQTSKR